MAHPFRFFSFFQIQNLKNCFYLQQSPNFHKLGLCLSAKDFAGNEKVSQIGFEIYEEKSLWQKIVEPVRKYIFYGNEKVIQDEKMVKEDKKEGKKKNIILWERAVLFGALIVVGIWKREKVKEIWKNLS